MHETAHPQLRIEIDPEKIVLTEEEILADLLYPAPARVVSIDGRREHGPRHADARHHRTLSPCRIPASFNTPLNAYARSASA